MRKHAPAWQSELAQSGGVDDCGIHARKLMDDLDEQFEASDGDDTPGWGQLLTFLCASALFVVVVLTWKSGS
ncbi:MULTISPECIES: hypothetical protein [Novosphingobium]|uniref:hypothetical protein n=1 Tax=Novosphingobium TaxID=165696 RepID=UPI001CD24ACF|nr:MULTISPECIES: hypothetical protein [Novosphingobium]